MLAGSGGGADGVRKKLDEELAALFEEMKNRKTLSDKTLMERVEQTFVTVDDLFAADVENGLRLLVA